MNTGDASYIKNLNRRIIIEKVIEHRQISRADLSKITGLNKATVSSQVASLLKDGLFIEEKKEYSKSGRKPFLLSLNPNAGYAIGIDINTKVIHFIVTNLTGGIIQEHNVPIVDHSFGAVKNLLIDTIASLTEKMEPHSKRLIGIGIGVHGIVDNHKRIVFTPRHNWANVDLRGILEERFQVPVYLDNNSNLCAFAEKVYSHKTDNLLCLTTYSGIGLGIIIDNDIYKGIDGFAGETGHMIIVPGGKPCPCGNLGCWEQYASEESFLNNLAQSKGLSQCTMTDVSTWIDSGDPEIFYHLDEFSKYMQIGINNIINIFNPETVIINSELFSFHPDLINKIKNGLTSIMNRRRNILLSKLGKKACSLGASAICIKNFLNVSDITLEMPIS